jgi:hypothetical protein
MTVPGVLTASVAKVASERTAGIHPSVIPKLSLLEIGSHQWRRRQQLLSRLTLRRSTPIMTTALSFTVQLDSEGAMEEKAHRVGGASPARRRDSLLPPSGGPTQAGTTACVAFRAAIGASGKVELDVVL